MKRIRIFAALVSVIGGALLSLPDEAVAQSGMCYVCGYSTCPSEGEMIAACNNLCQGTYSHASCPASGDYCGWHPGAPIGILCSGNET